MGFLRRKQNRETPQWVHHFLGNRNYFYLVFVVVWCLFLCFDLGWGDGWCMFTSYFKRDFVLWTTTKNKNWWFLLMLLICCRETGDFISRYRMQNHAKSKNCYSQWVPSGFQASSRWQDFQVSILQWKDLEPINGAKRQPFSCRLFFWTLNPWGQSVIVGFNGQPREECHNLVCFQ